MSKAFCVRAFAFFASVATLDSLPASAAPPLLQTPIIGLQSAATTTSESMRDILKSRRQRKHPYVRNWVLTGFISKHFREDDRENDYNAGAFFEHDFSRNWGFFGGQYRNSGNIQSRLFAAKYEPFHYRGFGAGLVAGAIDGYIQLNHGKLAFAGLPFVSYTAGRVKTQMFCVPPVIKTAAPVCSLQFGYDLGDATLGL